MGEAKYWDRAWQEARRRSSLSRGYPNEEGWREFWDLFAPYYARRNRENRAEVEAVIDYLAGEGVVDQAGAVLDVGCGPGTYTLPLAARAHRVTALDTAENMLAILRQEAARYGAADRIETAAVSWDQFPDRPAFDLVFAAKTPAVGDYDSLMKMNRVSRRYCVLITFAGAYRFSLRDALWEELMGVPLHSRAFDVRFPFNILYEEGFYPNLRFFHCRETCRETPEYLCRHFQCYFRIFGQEGPELQEKIRDFLMKRSTEGYCEDVAEGTIAVMWWKAAT